MSVLKNLSDDKVTGEVLEKFARMAEGAERFDDMSQFMTKLLKIKVKEGKEISKDLQNLFAVAFKNVLSAKRMAWRAFCDVDEDDELAELYKKEVEKEINEICDNVLQFLEKDLVPATKGQNNEAEVFYLKMAGDYCRYKSELKDEVDDTAEKGRKFYERASKVACDNLPATDPVRLGVALNESVFYYEILRQNEKACEIAKKAFDLAIADLDTMDQSSFKDSTLIMQLLRDNLTLWAQANEADPET